ncbi:MAG: hypothetical protein H0Z28_06025 [Archaeoglobus sp.]|nr:hypothetical protein [Archaeoglobus sp.]
MDSLGESDKIGYVVQSIKEGITLFIKNLQLVIPVLAVMILSYFLIVFAVLAIIPAEKVEEIMEKYGANITSSEKVGEEVLKEFSDYLTKNITRTISVFILFGLAVFVLQEFNTAGLAASSLEISKGGSVSISNFLEKAFIYTLRMVQVDLLAILMALAVSFPLILLFYLSQNLAFEIALSPVLILVILITTFARFYALQDFGIFDSFANGTRFFFKNILAILLLFFSWFVISFPLISLSFLFPPLIFFWPALLLLFYLLLAKFYVLVSKAESKAEEDEKAGKAES